MAVIRFRDPFYDPSGSIRSLRREMDRLFNSFFNTESSLAGSNVYPQVNIYREGGNTHVTAELPGIETEDLDISVHGKSLVLRGARKIDPGDKDLRYHRRERSAGSFNRVISLPEPVDADGVIAQYKNGVLTLTLPVAEEAKPRQIEVSAQ